MNRNLHTIGITVIDIPYWWNKEIGSLKATIKKYRPELIQESNYEKPIPETAPIQSTENSQENYLTHIELHLVMIPEEYEEDIDPTGWWMSEKYDGIRCTWDGRFLRSKHGSNVRIFPIFEISYASFLHLIFLLLDFLPMSNLMANYGK